MKKWKFRPWRCLYTGLLTVWAVSALGWPAALFLTAIQLDILPDAEERK